MNGDHVAEAREGIGFRTCTVEITPYDARLVLDIKATVYEEGGVEPTKLIGADQDWYVEVEWCLRGPLVHHLCGRWCPRLQIDCFGGGTEATFAPDPRYIDFDPAGDGCYKTRIRVPAGTVDPDECGSLCELAVVLSTFDYRGQTGHIFASCEGPSVMVHPATHDD